MAGPIKEQLFFGFPYLFEGNLNLIRINIEIEQYTKNLSYVNGKVNKEIGTICPRSSDPF